MSAIEQAVGLEQATVVAVLLAFAYETGMAIALRRETLAQQIGVMVLCAIPVGGVAWLIGKMADATTTRRTTAILAIFTIGYAALQVAQVFGRWLDRYLEDTAELRGVPVIEAELEADDTDDGYIDAEIIEMDDAQR